MRDSALVGFAVLAATFLVLLVALATFSESCAAGYVFTTTNEYHGCVPYNTVQKENQ